jgi:hypothetical protein
LDDLLAGAGRLGEGQEHVGCGQALLVERSDRLLDSFET